MIDNLGVSHAAIKEPDDEGSFCLTRLKIWVLFFLRTLHPFRACFEFWFFDIYILKNLSKNFEVLKDFDFCSC